jgi:hypothetical protein
MSLCIDCWHDLDSCRAIGPVCAGAIPYTAILEWCRHNGVDRDMTSIVIEVIQRLDSTRADRIASELRKGAP